MALAHLVLSLSPSWRGFGNAVLDEKRRAFALALRGGGGGGAPSAGKTVGGIADVGSQLSRREIAGRSRLKVTSAPVVESGQKVGLVVEIPVTCYQILGVPEKAEKDEIVKAAMVLKGSEIEDGYTTDVIISRQGLLVDVRDKLLFEPEYAGSAKQQIPPKSSLRIPWAWLPGALCLLQEVGEGKLVLEIGRAALEVPDAKPYIHDLLLSMALAECSIAKIGFEKNKVSEGFEALARAQYLLRSKISLGTMPLLSQIEESLEELAPACTLELLSAPHTPDNAERRRGAIAALRELLRQGLDVEASCRVQDWPCFLSQAMKKLMATEIVDLVSWDSLAVSRKNKKSLESQSQRGIIDFECFYLAMIAHIALGFSAKQTDLISKAKTICECLNASEGMELKFEEAFCLLLLGQGTETEAVERLRQLAVNGSTVLRNIESIISSKEVKEKNSVHQFLETWLKDAVLCVFADTRDCSPSLANFFAGPKRILRCNKQSMGASKPVPSITHRKLSIGLSPEFGSSNEQPYINSAQHLGEAVKQLAPANLQSPLIVGKTTGITSGPSGQLRRNFGLQYTKIWDSWNLTEEIARRVSYAALIGCFIFGAFKLLCMQSGQVRAHHKWQSDYSRMNLNAAAWTSNNSPGLQSTTFIGRSICSRLGKLLVVFKQNLGHRTSAGSVQDAWPTDELSSLTTESAIAGTLIKKKQMPLEEAEALVKQWQEIKAEALGPHHQVQTLSEILAESMLSKWQDLANSAKAKSSFWRLVLLQLSILRADIVSDDVGGESAEIEAVLEEAAELVVGSHPRKPSYYSTYKVQYVLKRQEDGSWRFCKGCIQNRL